MAFSYRLGPRAQIKEFCSRILSEGKEEVIKHDLVKPGLILYGKKFRHKDSLSKVN